MNELKQITEEEAKELFCNSNCPGSPAIYNKECRERNKNCSQNISGAIKFGKKSGWIKPDPTPEEKFLKEAVFTIRNLCEDSFIDWIKPAIEKLAAEIRAERNDV